MSDGKIKLPRSSYEEIVKIIRAYARLEKPALLGEISKMTGMGETKISANVSFLSSIGVIEGGKAKIASSWGSALGLSLEHGLENEIKMAWQNVIKENDFLSKMITAISIRRGMEVSSLEAHIAYSAGEPKANYVATGARAVVDILKASGLVIQEGDRMLPLESKQNDESNGSITSSEKKPQIEDRKNNVPISTSEIMRYPQLIINININIESSVENLDELNSKLTEMINSVSKAGLLASGEQ